MMADAYSPERIEHTLQALSSLENMKSREFICDFKVKVEKRTFNTHRALLAACSGYFEALFSSNMKEAQHGYITMKDVRMTTIEQCIRYIYTGSCEIEMDSVEEILHASNMLQIQSLEKKCFNFLKNNLQPANCLFILNLARTFNCHDVENAAEDLVFNNLETVILSDLFVDISKKDLLRYIAHANHETCWRAVKTWSEGREEKFEELAERIDFSKLSFKILVNEVISDPLFDQSRKIKLIVLESLFSDSAKLEANLDASNCFRLKKFSTDENSKKIIDSFMCKNFSTIFSDPQFCSLTKDEIIRLIKYSEVDSEEPKWEASLKWVKHDVKGRKSSFPDLFSSLELLKLPLKFLEEILRNERLVKASIPCMNLLMDSFIKHAKQSSQSKEEAKSAEASKVDPSTIWYKQQPPGGEVEELVDAFGTELIFVLERSSYEGIQYPGCSFIYSIPNQNLLDRLQNAFGARQLFRLKHASGSDRGRIVLGDIPLDPDWNLYCSSRRGYVETLRHELEKKGF